MKPSSDPYKTKPKYLADMSNVDIYSTSCELMAAAKSQDISILAATIHDGTLLERTGESQEDVKRLKFSHNLMGGCFDPLLPPDEFLSLPTQQLPTIHTPN